MFLAYKTMNKQHLERLLLTGTVFLFAGYALLVMQPVLAVSVATKNKQAYQKMFTYLCSTKSNKVLKNTTCPLLKTYQKKQTTYTDVAFLKTACTKSKAACQIIDKNKAYQKITTPLLATPKKTTPVRTPEASSITQFSVQPETNSDELYAKLDDFVAYFPDNNDGFPESANYPPNQDNIYKPKTQSNNNSYAQNSSSIPTFTNPEEKIKFAISVLISGKDYRLLNSMEETDFTPEESVAIINGFRAFYGLDPVVLNQTITQIAERHVEYLAVNGAAIKRIGETRGVSLPEDFHNENPTLPKFTGMYPTDRATAYGYTKFPLTEVIIGEPHRPLAASVYDFLYAPLHRQIFLSANLKEIGFYTERPEQHTTTSFFADSSYGFTVINFAFDTTAASYRNLVYPANGTTIYDYTKAISEVPYPFHRNNPTKDTFSFALTINHPIGGLDRDSIRLFDVTTSKNLPLTIDEFSASPVVHISLSGGDTLAENHAYRLSFKDLNGNETTSEFKTGAEDF